MKIPLQPDVGNVTCRRTFLKQNTWLWKQWVPPPPSGYNDALKMKSTVLKTSLESESFILVLFECDVIHVNLKKRHPVHRYLQATFTMLPQARVLWHDGLIKAVPVPYWLYFSTEMTAIRTWSCWVTLFWKRLLPLLPLIKPKQCSSVFAYSTAGTLILIIS